MDVCAGGTIDAGANTITLTNNHRVACNITSCSMPGFPVPTQVPAKQGSTAGSTVVTLSSPATCGDYPYTPDCCDQGTPPAIKVQ